MVCLDHLEALVHQRRRVDRDAAAHLPGRVGERVGDAHLVRDPCGRGTGPPEAVTTSRSTVPGVSRADQLVERRMLGVDRDQELGAGRLGEGHHQLAAEHEALLVGERDVDPGGQRDHGGGEAGGADDAVEDEVRFGRARISSRTPSSPARTRPSQASPATGRGVAIGEGDRPPPRARAPARRSPPSYARRRVRPPAIPAKPRSPRAPASRSTPSTRVSTRSSSAQEDTEPELRHAKPAFPTLVKAETFRPIARSDGPPSSFGRSRRSPQLPALNSSS